MRLLLTLLCAAATLPAVTIAEKTKGLERLPGFLTLHWDARNGRMYLEIPRPGQEILYYPSLPAGLGSNDVGLDRGLIGQESVVRFERSGNRVLLIEQNYAFRATSTNPDERRAVADSFARSTLWGFTVEAETGDALLVDATAFFLSDARGVADRLKQSGQGTYRLDASRSAFFLERTKSFPQNTEVEVTLTFLGDPTGRFVRDVTPTPTAITLRQHHSFVELPDNRYQPRLYDPRAGYITTSYYDYSSPFTSKIEQRVILRHRLEKRNPAAASSEVVKPIVYYIDRGAPEPIRTALVEGGRWWAAAFEEAGFQNAFRVEVMPPGADPMDIRYNYVEWVHRATRGWSYGGAVADPRTGEILKGKVTLGSLRIRQDYLIAEGLLAPYDGSGRESIASAMALQRIRQLSAHEIGHTLGLLHNYAASTSDRASVMDYPHPLALANADGSIDLTKPYTNTIGAWDKAAIAWGYSQFAPGVNQRQQLNAILSAAWKRGVAYLGDADAADGGAHPDTHVWDNGYDAAVELRRVLDVRAKALARFGAANIREGAPMATLEEVLVPLYLSHRYQLAAAAKSLGGLRYTYALRGDGQLVTELLDPGKQRAALDALLATLDPAALELPERILRLIPPRPPGSAFTRELFRRRTGVAFDALAPAETAASLTLALLLHPDRAARLAEHHDRDATQPSLTAVLQSLADATFRKDNPNAIQRTVNTTALYHLMALAANENAAPAARGATLNFLTGMLDRIKAVGGPLDGIALERFLKDPSKITLPKPLEAPPGAPI